LLLGMSRHCRQEAAAGRGETLALARPRQNGRPADGRPAAGDVQAPFIPAAEASLCPSIPPLAHLVERGVGVQAAGRVDEPLLRGRAVAGEQLHDGPVLGLSCANIQTLRRPRHAQGAVAEVFPLLVLAAVAGECEQGRWGMREERQGGPHGRSGMVFRRMASKQRQHGRSWLPALPWAGPLRHPTPPHPTPSHQTHNPTPLQPPARTSPG
jgi:hypothetical protein